MKPTVDGCRTEALRLCRWVMQYLGTQRAQLRKLVKPTGKRLWMSEFGCGSSPPSDMGAALELSAMIMRVCSMQEYGCVVYCSYTTVSSQDRNCHSLFAPRICLHSAVRMHLGGLSIRPGALIYSKMSPSLLLHAMVGKDKYSCIGLYSSGGENKVACACRT